MGHAFPEFLPDGNRFLFFIASTDPNTRGIYLSALDAPGSRTRILATDTKASYVPPRAGRPGALLFLRGSNLVAQEFDPDTLRLSRDTELVAEGLMTYSFGTLPTGQAPFWSSPAGALLYRVGTLSYAVNWVDRTGRRSSTGMPVVHYSDLRISPDDTRVAIGRPQQGLIDLWQWDFGRRAWTLLTTEAYYANFPVWSADGSLIAFSLTSPGVSALSRRNSDGTGAIETLLEDDTQLFAHDWSRDGRYLLFGKASAKSSPNSDIWVLPLESPRTPVPFINGPFSEHGVKFSPIGKFVAFSSNETGQEEVYVQAFTESAPNRLTPVGPRRPVSPNGGSKPLWRGDGRELYFISSDNKMMAAEVQLAGETATVGTVQELFSATFMTLNVLPYGVTSDGKRFLVLEAQDRDLHPPFTVALNWQAALGDN
jgi:dipeptidyl aminopeptidase/acylaminoacyl peptidase